MKPLGYNFVFILLRFLCRYKYELVHFIHVLFLVLLFVYFYDSFELRYKKNNKIMQTIRCISGLALLTEAKKNRSAAQEILSLGFTTKCESNRPVQLPILLC